jgi:hypothetical protein
MAKLRPVKVGQDNGLETQVLGLKESDTVVLPPSDRIKDGVAVQPR